MKRIKAGVYDFDEDIWHLISEEGNISILECIFITALAKDLIRKLLVVDVTQRLDLDGCFEHPWMRKQRSLLEKLYQKVSLFYFS